MPEVAVEWTCPVCRAQVPEGPVCRRCRADLTWLLALEESCRHAWDRAVACLAEGDWPCALECARLRFTLKPDPQAQRLLAVAALLGRDFPLAVAAHRAVRA